jgi:hypothetical protein
MAKRKQAATAALDGADARLVALGRELRRTIRRARRQRHSPSGSSAWSSTIEDAFELVDQISTVRATGLQGLAIKLWTVTWFLDETDAVLDVKALRQLRALDREARRLAGRAAASTA